MVSAKGVIITPKKKNTKGKAKQSKKIIQKKENKKVLKDIGKNIEKSEKNKRSKYILPSTYVTDNLVSSVLSCLKKLTADFTKKKAIFGDEYPIYMTIRCMKIQNIKGNLKFVLPHGTISPTSEVCLITKDLKKGKKVDHEPTIDHWEELLRKANVTSVKTILPMRQVRVEYDQYELKRRLLTQHDFVMVDTRVMNHVSHELGKIFLKKHNMFIPVKLNEEGDIKKSIDTGLRTVILRLSDGLTSTVLVGNTSMPENHIKDNIIALVHKLKERFPGGEENIRSLDIKLPLSLALPLYMSLRSSNSIKPPKIKVNKPKEFAEYEGELTTKLGSIVRVAPDGTVHCKKVNDKEDDISDEEDPDEKMQSDQENDQDKSENES